MSIVDAPERALAIHPGRSFCVSAPAGSGKTELLIQRYLGLLARVERPEQVLAITFTRKAAAEMRGRVVEALQAARADAACDSAHQRVTRELALGALAADECNNWQLERNISRFNIKTIDSFCGALTRQMPVLSEFGGQAALLDDATELYAEAVTDLFRQLDEGHPAAADMAALMLHFDNNWERLQDLLVRMLARREQWRPYVGLHHAPEESEAYLVATVTALVAAELAALSERLAPYQGELLDLWQYAAGNLGQAAPPAFPGNDPQDVAAWRSLRDLLLTKEGSWRKSVSTTTGFPAGQGEAQARKAQLKALLAELAQLDGLEQLLADVTFLPEMAPGSDAWQLLIHLSRVLPMLAAQLLLVFQRRGAVDHSQVALSALQALGEDDAPTELALRLDYRIEHILVDEFQDTAINQYELLRLLTRGWGSHNASNPGAPRTIMVVGDGMQSIYGFRGANVGLFLKARQQGFNGVRLEPLNLQCNFRSDAGVVEWVNTSFAAAFPAEDDVNRGRVRYTPATAVRPHGARPAVGLHVFTGEQARDQEVEFICAEIAAACARPSGESIAVLGRSRGQLQPVLAGMQRRGIAYAAQDMDSLAESALVGDLFSLCCALANPADRLAWMALLRAPWCGLQLSDLHRIAQWGETPRFTPLLQAMAEEDLRRTLSDDGRRRVEALHAVLAWAQQKRDRLGLRAWIECTWLQLGGPATAAAEAELADAESFLQLLEQAEQEGLGLDTQWLSRRLEKQYMNAGEPGARVQVMTLHKAKGLEFDLVIMPQLARPPRADGRQLMLWDEHGDMEGERRFLLAADDHSGKGEATLYNYLQQRRAEKSLLEGTRLLYVGATRAVRGLLLTASLATDPKSGALRPPPPRSLLSPIWDSCRQQVLIHEPALLPAPARIPTQRPLARLRRLPGAGVATAAQARPGGNVPARAANLPERSVGTVVHLALEELSGRANLPEQVSDRDRQRWRAELVRTGLWGDGLAAAIAEVEQAVVTTLAAGGAGRWLLGGGHRQARSEWALTSVDPDGGIQELVIDRTFIDSDTGVRWVIDYKSSRPAPQQSLEDFLAGQAAAYREQLLRYRRVLRELGPEPLRCALYFTALGHLYHLPDLDLASAEQAHADV
jgi:ATP-dependent exoDNAse (exonuclease V) beta subunit